MRHESSPEICFGLSWSAVVLAFAAFSVMPSEALGLQILFDSRLGPGQNLFTTQGLHYEAGVGWAGSAKATAISFDDVTFIPLIDGTFDAHSSFAGATVDPNSVTGHFVPTNDGLDSFVVRDMGGVLVSGKYYGRQMKIDFGVPAGISTSTFQATGGSLLALFLAAAHGDGLIDFDMFDLTPPGSPGSFASDFDGAFAGRVAPMPEPATLMLVGIGMLALVRRRRRTNASN